MFTSALFVMAKFVFLRRSTQHVYRGTEAHNHSLDHDTVGAVAMDKDGNIAVATSTGGISCKRPGRVGDSPIIGEEQRGDDSFDLCSHPPPPPPPPPKYYYTTTAIGTDICSYFWVDKVVIVLGLKREKNWEFFVHAKLLKYTLYQSDMDWQGNMFLMTEIFLFSSN